MSTNQTTVRIDTSGLFSTLLLLLFITLKLTGVIAWSWWWVLSPLWIPLLLFILGAFVLLVIHIVKG